MKQRHLTLSILAIIAPWLVFFIKDDPIMAFVTLVLQATIIGWPVTVIWVWRNIHQAPTQQAETTGTSSTTEMAQK